MWPPISFTIQHEVSGSKGHVKRQLLWVFQLSLPQLKSWGCPLSKWTLEVGFYCWNLRGPRFMRCPENLRGCPALCEGVCSSMFTRLLWERAAGRTRPQSGWPWPSGANTRCNGLLPPQHCLIPLKWISWARQGTSKRAEIQSLLNV